MSDILPSTQEELYNFIVAGVAPSPQQIHALALNNFTSAQQAIINAPGNPIGSMFLTAAVMTSAILARVVELNSNLLFTDSQGEQLRRNLYNFGNELIPATRTVVRQSFDISATVTIAAGTVYTDDIDQEFMPIIPFTAGTGTGEINLYSVLPGNIAPQGIPTPRTTISNISNFAIVSVTPGRPEETQEAAKIRLENSGGSQIFGTAPFVEAALLRQTEYVLAARGLANNRNTTQEIQNIDVDANSMIFIARPLITPAETVAAIGSTINASIKGGQKISQPPITDVPQSLRGVSLFSGFADETALNAAGYEIEPSSPWAVWTPDRFEGTVVIPFILAQPQNIEITYNVSFPDSVTEEQRNSLRNQITRISLQRTPVFSQSFARIQISQYYNSVLAEINDGSVTIDSIFLSVKGDAAQQNQQSIISDLNSFLNLVGTITDGTAVSPDVTINEV